MFRAIHFPNPHPGIDVFRPLQGVPADRAVYTYAEDGKPSMVGFEKLDELETYIKGCKDGSIQKGPNDQTLK